MLAKLKTPKISVLIPVYNVEKYVERCILSVLNQTLQEEIEVIIVNDCTLDRSMIVIDKVLENLSESRKQLIKIINNKKNKGIAFTRNEALKYATGEYILQIDSDDYLETDMIEKMYNKDEILEMYLNITYLGEGNYGIQAASQYYYHIDAIDLNKQQSDILVKTLKRPSVYNPSKVN